MGSTVRKVAILQVLKCNGTEQHDSGKTFPIRLIAPQFSNEINKQAFMFVCIIWTVKGFIKSKHGKYNICLNMLEVFIHGNKSLTSWIFIGPVPRK